MWPFNRTVKTQRTPSVRMGPRLSVRAKYDAAQTTSDNRRHWANADALSADAAMSVDVRRTLRNRARYEVANNSYAKGIVLTLANDVIGTGPRLQLITEKPDDGNDVEDKFAQWCQAVRLAEKLRTSIIAECESGEIFLLLTTNPMIGPVNLDIQTIEADRVATPTILPDNSVDGIVLDAYGNPVEYHVLRNHPGSAGGWASLLGESDTIKAENIIHLFRADRPGQHRGIPELTPALPLFAQLRRYTLAVLDAAETAADFAAVLYTEAPANGEAEDVEAMDLVELEKRMATVLPKGWNLGQIKAEQPATTYPMFKQELLNEIARCLNMPYNIAAGNSSNYNYASGRLDHQTYYKSIRVKRHHCETLAMDRIFKAWLDEAVLIENYLPQSMRTNTPIQHEWFWDGQEHVDPAKEATAQATRLSSLTTTLADEYAKQGRDWETQLRQAAKEKTLMKELGLVMVAPEKPKSDQDESEEELEDADAEK